MEPQAVNNFRNETGYTKRIRKAAAAAQVSAQGAPTQASAQRPPLRLATSRQQDPLMANVPSSTADSTPPQSTPAAPLSPVSTHQPSSTPPSSSSSTVHSSTAPAESNYSPVVNSPQHSTKQDDPPSSK